MSLFAMFSFEFNGMCVLVMLAYGSYKAQKFLGGSSEAAGAIRGAAQRRRSASSAAY